MFREIQALQRVLFCFAFTSLLLVLSYLPANGSTTEKPELADPSSKISVDLTEIVVAALVLGFSYGVLQTFKGSSGK